MKKKIPTAHLLVEQFVEWTRLGLGLGLNYPAVSAFARYLHTGDESKSDVHLQPWFSDDHAMLINRLLMNLKEDHEYVFKVFMYYFFNFQQWNLASQKFKKPYPVIKELVNSGLMYIDGQLRILSE